MKLTNFLRFAATSSVGLSLLAGAAMTADARGGRGDTLLELLRETDGAQAFVAVAEEADESECDIVATLDDEKTKAVVFAPSNRAFEEFFGLRRGFFDGFSIGDIRAFLNSVTPSTSFCEVLERHVAIGEKNPKKEATVAELLARGGITVEAGPEFPISVSSGDVMVNYESEIGYGDIVQKKSIIHFVKSVIRDEPLPPPPAEDAVTVFVTSVPHDGNFGGLNGADQFCQDLADGAGLSGTWTAWLSTDAEDAGDRIGNAEYRLVDGTLVANSLADLTDGTLIAPINLSEKGGSGATSTVWTSTQPNGNTINPVAPANTYSNCQDWMSNDTETGGCTNGDLDCAALGNANETDGDWTLQGGTASPFVSQCSALNSIYCFGR